jgi:ribosomal protein L37E
MQNHNREIQCPRCGKARGSRNGACEHCGYDGYVPMSDEQIKKIKLILYPIAVVLAVLAMIVVPLLFGKA